MVCVIGEALIDLVLDPLTGDTAGTDGYLAHPGGSPFNVAIGLARLGQPSHLLARLSSDAFGRQLRRHAEANAVDLSLAVAAPEASTLAVVSLDERRNATYDFYRTGTADWQWTAAELAVIPDDAGWVHTGSIASWTPPGDDVIEARLAELALSGTVISYDPNIRAALIDDRSAVLARAERLIGLSSVVKASAEDLEWMYPGESIPAVLERWRRLGPKIVVITDGAAGAHVVAGGEAFTVAGRRVDVVDTVGAGDAFMAGLINAVARDKVLVDFVTDEAARAVVDEAILVAALTCARAGANPPTAAELAAAR